MKKFWYRLRVYLIGVLLGIGLVYVFFQERTSVLTSWTPNNRVKQEVEYKGLLQDSTWKCYTFCLGVEDEAAFFQTADVVFSESNPQSNPKEYLIHFTQGKQEHVKATVLVGDSTATLSTMVGMDFSLDCECGGK